MITHKQIRKALRDKLAALSVATTGAISMSVNSSNGFVRTVGSFYDDGFAPGMELVSAGFTGGNSLTAAIIALTDTVCTVDRTLTTEDAAGGRTLAVGLPSTAVYAGEAYSPDAPTTSEPYWEEQYVPGPSSQISFGGVGGTIELRPIYSPRFCLPAKLGADAADLYVDAMLTLFAPKTAMSLANGDVLRVRADPAPYPGQALNDDTGRLIVPVNIPLRLLTANSI